MTDRLTLLNKLRETLNQRADLLGWRKANGQLSKAGREAALEFLIGAASAVEALGLEESHSLTGIAWLASVRGAEDFMEG